MQVPADQPQTIYLAKVTESLSRLRASDLFLHGFQRTGEFPQADAAILQVRKALEAIAFASIVPNKAKYQEFRARSEDQPDYTKDYHAKKILHVLGKINKDFYPLALMPAVRKPDGTLHFERKTNGVLSKKRFAAIYDRLGRHLHAANPWSANQGLESLLAELPSVLSDAFGLLEIHATFIQTPEFKGVWVIEAPRVGAVPRVVTGKADGEFFVEGS